MKTLGELKAVASDAFAGTPVKFAYLFGSVARGDATPRSDVDIAIFVDPAVPASTRLDLGLDLRDMLAMTLKEPPVDLLVLNDASLALRGRVLKEGLLLYSTDEPARVGYDSLTFREFVDFEIFVAPLREAFIQDMAKGRR